MEKAKPAGVMNNSKMSEISPTVLEKIPGTPAPEPARPLNRIAMQKVPKAETIREILTKL